MDYLAKDIRNVCLMGHKGYGKTTLTEALLYYSKATDRLGKVEQGNTVSDFDPEEVKRKLSISLTVNPFTYKNTKINLIDTPGFYDFEGEQNSALSAVDTAIIVITSKTTVSVGTEKAMLKCRLKKKPVVFFNLGLDDENADFYKTLDQLYEKFGESSIVPAQLPIIESGKFVGAVDVIDGKAYKFNTDGTYTPCYAPAELEEDLRNYRSKMLELIAETDEELMAKYFDEEPFTEEEIFTGVKNAILQRVMFPVFLGVPTEMFGMQRFIENIVDYFPTPLDSPAVKAGDDEIVCDENGNTVVRVFKTIADPFVGKLSFYRIYSGKVVRDETYQNTTTDEKEKIAHVYTPFGKKQIEVDYLNAGDIGVFTKLNKTRTSDTLCGKGISVSLDPIVFPIPNFAKSTSPKKKGDEEKISQGIKKLMEEDPTLKLVNNTETKQQVIYGMGDMQLDVVTSKLASKFQAEMELKEARVAYRETIRKKVKVQGKHKKQSGGHGQYGDVWIEFEPCYDSEFEFAESVFGGSVPKNFFPAVEKGLRDSIQKGVLAGYPVTNIKATLVDGSYHPVDSSEMAFKTAASIAFKEGMKQASPVLLEPIGTLVVNVSDKLMGDIIGDINKRRGQVLSMDNAENERGRKIVTATVPMSEISSYAMDLRSMTHGRASFTFDFLEYREAPANIVTKIIAEAEKEE